MLGDYPLEVVLLGTDMEAMKAFYGAASFEDLALEQQHRIGSIQITHRCSVSAVECSVPPFGTIAGPIRHRLSAGNFIGAIHIRLGDLISIHGDDPLADHRADVLPRDSSI